MKSTDIKNHKTSSSQTHNLEVLGSSPSWSTLKIKRVCHNRHILFFCFYTAVIDSLIPMLLFLHFSCRFSSARPKQAYRMRHKVQKYPHQPAYYAVFLFLRPFS